MAETIIINGSPRAPRSNSKRYAEILKSKLITSTEYVNISKNNHNEIIEKINYVKDVILVFPLYVDALPSTLLSFLKTLENANLTNKPAVSVLINCGFLEYKQNDIAINMVKIFCKQNGYPFGAVLSIGGGEAILDTPFKSLVNIKIGAFAKSINNKQYKNLHLTMPLTKKMYIKGSTGYWSRYGAKNGLTKEEMEIMTIE